MDNPLTLTLLRDSYPANGPVDEILDTERFPTPGSIEDHLLDHLLPAVYEQPRSRYSLATAQRTLGYLARHLNHDGTRDLAWWNIPQWTALVSPLLTSLLSANLLLVLVVAFGAAFEGAEGLLLGMVVALGLMTVMGMANVDARVEPRRVRVFRWREPLTRKSLVLGLVGGTLTGIASGVSFGGETWLRRQ